MFSSILTKIATPLFAQRASFSYKTFSERYYEPHLVAQNNLSEVEYPDNYRRLHPVQKQVTPPPGSKLYKYATRSHDLHGPEEIHNKLVFKQFGIQATYGGELKFGHFEMLRLTINRRMEEKRMFAQWRVPQPWKGKTKRSLGKRMGGGKPDIKFFVTPVREGRIIVELGGNLTWKEAYRLLHDISMKLPFPARFVSQELLDCEDEISLYIQQHNVNPFADKVQHVMLKNYAGSQEYLSPWHFEWKSPHFKIP
ncbi:mitochondrial ribosomal large subunit component [Cichlidogyrus casuarinus]|uniref:Large ribosomal subunit protein uL16m n=1 Tax=Cichlidogyrus casuarinus TaxID=1844966 RepID=A0ABD2Q6Z0_9PLAT